MNNLLFVLLDASAVRLIFSSLFDSLVWLGFFSAVFFAYYYYLQALNRERMAMIEKGADLSELYKHKSRFQFRMPWFKLIFTILGIGLGGLIIILFTMFSEDKMKGHNEEPFIFLGILIFGALGMLAGHFMDTKFNKKKED